MRVAILVACVLVLSSTTRVFGAPYEFTRVVDTTGILDGIRLLTLNDRGQVAFYGYVNQDLYDYGVFTAGDGVPLTLVSPAPYDSYQAPPAINNHGAIAFNRRLDTETGMADIVLWENGRETVLMTGNGQPYYSLTSPAINDHGDVVFAAHENLLDSDGITTGYRDTVQIAKAGVVTTLTEIPHDNSGTHWGLAITEDGTVVSADRFQIRADTNATSKILFDAAASNLRYVGFYGAINEQGKIALLSSSMRYYQTLFTTDGTDLTPLLTVFEEGLGLPAINDLDEIAFVRFKSYPYQSELFVARNGQFNRVIGYGDALDASHRNGPVASASG